MSDAESDARPEVTPDTGFAPPRGRELGRERSTTAVAALIATIGLTIAVIAAVTVVSMGFAQAETPETYRAAGSQLSASDGIALAVLLALLFAGVAGMVGDLSELRHRRHLH